MTRAEIVELLTQKAELSRKQAAGAVAVVLEGMVAALRRGEKVELRGLGSFRVRERRGRQARNPRTGAQVKVGPKRVVHFKPGKQLRQLLG